MLLALCCTACATAAEQRRAIEASSAAWAEKLEPGSQEEVIEGVRCLAEQSPREPDSLFSLLTLCRQVRAGGNPSALVRAECLRAAWRLARQIPAEELRVDDLDAAEFSKRSTRFEQLAGQGVQADQAQLLELVRFLGEYRFAPGSEDLALDLAELVVTRGILFPAGPPQQLFLQLAPGSVRHALVLVTLRAADDRSANVRREALAAASEMQPGPGLDLIAGALGIETDRQVLLTAMDSLAVLATSLDAQSVRSILALVQPSADLSVRRAAAALERTLGP